MAEACDGLKGHFGVPLQLNLMFLNGFVELGEIGELDQLYL